ncbi:MAG TPA: hypothetical protein VHO68_00150, partial [Bacteroidales bacterium]|nr:hypothetical protein [Bacteroidales bacterium]
PISNPETTKENKLVFIDDNVELQAKDPSIIKLEGKQNAQNRLWLVAFLDAADVIISLIIAVFAGLKQLEDEEKRKKKEAREEGEHRKQAQKDEEKRQRSTEIKQAIDSFVIDLKSEFSSALQKYIVLVQDWGEWERPLQNQFREKLEFFFRSDLCWEILLDKSVSDLEKDISLLLRVCTSASVSEKYLKEVKLLHKFIAEILSGDISALQELLKEYRGEPLKRLFITRIARQKFIFSPKLPELQKDVIEEYRSELGFITTDKKDFVLRERFQNSLVEKENDSTLIEWLQKHNLHFSPFIDADIPYTLWPNKKTNFFIDAVTSGFNASLDKANQLFSFTSTWDLQAALYEFCKNLPDQIQKEIFAITLIARTLVDHQTSPQAMVLHQLAEEWLWLLARDFELFYDLKQTHYMPLVKRLLIWHCGSPSATIGRLTQLREIKSNNKHIAMLDSWLSKTGTEPFHLKEINAFIELRPPAKNRTLLIASSSTLPFELNDQLINKHHQSINEIGDWLEIHNWTVVHFMLSKTGSQAILPNQLTQQCRQRVQVCSNGLVDAFDLLFAPHDKEPADIILAGKANGSPGEMVRLGQKLLLQHVEKCPPEEDLHIEDLIAIQ